MVAGAETGERQDCDYWPGVNPACPVILIIIIIITLLLIIINPLIVIMLCQYINLTASSLKSVSMHWTFPDRTR